jgi:hypothetical protein
VLTSSTHECYGYRVRCRFEPAAEPVVRAFFGPPVAAGSRFSDTGASLELTFTVDAGQAQEPSEPPHNPTVLAPTPIVIDTGTSRAELYPAQRCATIRLAPRDLTDPIVWGRWMLERLFLYLVLRSPDCYPLHAGAIEVGGRVAVVTAAGGGGKSTLVFAAFSRGAGLAGEDIMVRHLREGSPKLWGYPRALYVAPDFLVGNRDLASAVAAPVAEGGKSRVTLPDAVSDRLRFGVRPDCMLFLSRTNEVGAPRPVTVADAIERSREDFAAGKDSVGLAAVEADLRGLLSGIPIWDFDVSDDLDETFARVRSTIHSERS